MAGIDPHDLGEAVALINSSAGGDRPTDRRILFKLARALRVGYALHDAVRRPTQLVPSLLGAVKKRRGLVKKRSRRPAASPDAASLRTVEAWLLTVHQPAGAIADAEDKADPLIRDLRGLAATTPSSDDEWTEWVAALRDCLGKRKRSELLLALHPDKKELDANGAWKDLGDNDRNRLFETVQVQKKLFKKA